MAPRAGTRGPSDKAIETVRNGKRVSIQLSTDVAGAVIAIAMNNDRSVSYTVDRLVKEALDARAARGDERL